MRFLLPTNFLALSLVLPILLLYMLRLRRQDVVVPSTLLWDVALADRHANRPWQKLRRNWLLFLQLLILLILVVALARPAISVPFAVHGQVIVLLDASASMQALTSSGTRFETALRELRKLSATLAADDRVSLIAVGPEPRLWLQGGDALSLRRVLDEIATSNVLPSDGSADWHAASALAAGLVSGDDVTTLLVTDAAVRAELPALPGTVRLIAIGEAVDNVGIVAFALRRDTEGLTAFVRLSNVGTQTTRTLALYADGVLIERREVTVPADSDVPLSFIGLPVQYWAEARLEETDALAVDNRAWVALSGASDGRVLLVSQGNRFLAQALQLLPDLTVTQSPELVQTMSTTETLLSSYGLIVVDGILTQTLSSTNVWLIAPSAETVCGIPGEILTPTQAVRGEWSHPILDYVDWRDVHISRMRHYTPPSDAEIVLETAEAPLFWIVERPNQRAACMAFDIHDSDLPLRLAFPVLTANLVGWLLPRASVEPILPFSAGEFWFPPLPADATQAMVVLPDGTQQPLSVDTPDSIAGHTGLYRIEVDTLSGQIVRYVGVSLLDEVESDLRPQDVSIAGQRVAPITQDAPGWRDVSLWILLVATSLLLLEALIWWRPFRRRRGERGLGSEGHTLRWGHLPQILSRLRISTPVMLRLLLLLCLILSMLNVRISRRTRDLAVVFLLDRSASTRVAWDAQVAFIQEALTHKSLRDRAALVVFGGDAWVERPLSSAPELSSIATLSRIDATNIAEAVRLGLALIPDGAPGRLILLTDALETSGQAAQALRQAGANNVEVLVTQSGSGTPGAEVWISDLHVPSRAYVGDRVSVSVDVNGNVAQELTLVWMVAGQSGQIPFDLQNATNILAFNFSATETGFLPLRVCLEPEIDTFLQNNCADGWVLVEGSPQILVVGDTDEREMLAAALQQAGLAVEQAEPGALPMTVQGMRNYAAIVLVNTPARVLSPQTMQALHSYVRDLGGGLVAVGGPQSYGVGGWMGTPLEDALPVEMRVQDPSRFPPLAMVVVIDKSGSMGVPEGGVPKIRLAAEAAIRVAEMLNDTDTLAVVAFDDRPADTFGPVSMTQREALIARLRRLQAGGGGIYVRESIAYAADLLHDTELAPGTQRHILLLADGSDAEHQEGVIPMVSDLLADGTTASVVSIGGGSDVSFLRRMATTGEGRFYLTQRAADLPAIFSEEAAKAKRSYIVEEFFYPSPVSSWGPVADLRTTPPLQGYVAATPKGAAQVVWEATQQDPLLAVWQYGLGRSVAWTSDATGRWASGWVSWDAFAEFWGAVVRYVLLPPADTGVALRIVPGDDVALAFLDASTPQGRYVDGLDLALAVAQPGSDTELILLQLHQTAPGRYQGAFDIPEQRSTQLLRVYGDRVLTAGWSPPASKEYIPDDAARAVSRLIAQGGGKVVSEPDQVFAHTLVGREKRQPLASILLLLAVLLWPVDIAWRRLALTRTDFVRIWIRIRTWAGPRRLSEPTPAPEVPPTLARTLRRKTQRRARRENGAPQTPLDDVEASVSPTLIVREPSEIPKSSHSSDESLRSSPEPQDDDNLASRLKRRIRD